MYRRDDPRLRRTLNQLSQNLESANESAQAGLYNLTQNYVDPCVASIGNCFQQCTGTCFPTREERLRRNRAGYRGRAEVSFDFYDDWENEENEGLLGWRNDELDRLLGGASGYGTLGQPARERAMVYGTRRDVKGGPRRKSAVQPHDGGPDPTIIPSSSYFGFLGRLPWNIGGKGLRYKPSAADLTEHVGVHRAPVEDEPSMEESGDDGEGLGTVQVQKQRRKRSQTTASAHTTDSLSSRGDIFPSEDEIDDAVPLDDEFAMALERRTNSFADEIGSRTGFPTNTSSRSRLSARTVSSRSVNSAHRIRANSDPPAAAEVRVVACLVDLRKEDDRAEQEEEAAIQKRRDAAQRLAVSRGMNATPISGKHAVDSTAHGPYRQTTPAVDRGLGTANPIPAPVHFFENGEINQISHTGDIGGLTPSRKSDMDKLATPINENDKSTTFVPAKLPFFSNPET